MRAYKFLDEQFGLKSLYERRLKISRIDELNDPFELLPYDLTRSDLRQAFLKTRDDMVADRGLLCFSAAWRDPVIWAHYSDKHKGLCLGFEIPAISGNNIDDEVMQVCYEPRPLPFPNNYLELTSQEWPAFVQKVLSTKFDNWKYEEEIRIWVPWQDNGEAIQFLDFGNKLHLKEVVLGARCTLPTSAMLRALGPLASEVKLTKARAAHHAFEMVEEEEFH